MANSNYQASLSSKKEYTRYFGGFRGVDFSSDHTDVLENRFAYAVNVYKDYQSGQGTAVETIPGFRRRVVLDDNTHPILAVHKTLDPNVYLIHQGTKLYESQLSGDASATVYLKYVADLKTAYLYEYNVKDASVPPRWLRGRKLNINGYYVVLRDNGDRSVVLPKEDKFSNLDGCEFAIDVYDFHLISEGMSERKAVTFCVNNRLYMIDGSSLQIYFPSSEGAYENGGVAPASVYAYIPTTYAEITDDLEEKGYTEAYEQMNLLGNRARNIFYVNFENTDDVYLYPRTRGTNVRVFNPNGEELTGGEYCTIETSKGYVSSIRLRQDHTNEIVTGQYTVEIYGVETYVSSGKDTYTGKDAINGCTVGAIYDGRLFLSGNPNLPNHVFWCGINQETNLPDPTYWGEFDWVQDGVGNTPVTGMITVADSLMVLKGETQGEGSVYYHSRYETGRDIAPVTYPPTQGLYGTGCLGACTNFLDDPVFLSRFGLEGIGTLSVRLERAIEHRSSLVDAKLINLPGLQNADMCEWNGYLCILVDGKIFMADSRQRYTDSNGVMQYEWYYLEDIGVWGDDDVFYPATCLTEINGNLFFGTANGVMCSFNFDKREDNGEIKSLWYDFDGKPIYSAIATKMDNCAIPHLTKSTVKNSIVIKTRTMERCVAKVLVRTNKSAYDQLKKIVSSRFTFESLDFEDLSFETESTTLFAIREKTKRWMEKQYFIYTDELYKPFSINYIAYRYTVAGRYKE